MNMASRIVLIKRYTQVKVTEVSLTSPKGEQHDVADEDLDPFNAMSAKIEALSDILDCSLEEAERFLLDRQ